MANRAKKSTKTPKENRIPQNEDDKPVERRDKHPYHDEDYDVEAPHRHSGRFQPPFYRSEVGAQKLFR